MARVVEGFYSFTCTLTRLFMNWTNIDFALRFMYARGLFHLLINVRLFRSFVSVEAKLSFVEPGRRWAHNPSPSKAPGISYLQDSCHTSVATCKSFSLIGAICCFLYTVELWNNDALKLIIIRAAVRLEITSNSYKGCSHYAFYVCPLPID